MSETDALRDALTKLLRGAGAAKLGLARDGVQHAKLVQMEGIAATALATPRDTDTKAVLEDAIAFIEGLAVVPLLMNDDIEMRLEDVQTHARIEAASLRKRLADRATRPAEPAAPVAEAGDGEVVSWPHHLNEAMDALTSAFQWLKNIRYGISCAEEAVASTEKMIAHVYEAIDAEPPLVRLSTLEAERARADELRRLLTASGRCVDDLTARLDAFEHAQEKARDEGFNHALSILEDALGSPTYYAADGSETWEGDTRGTIYNLLRASGVWRGDDDMLVTKDRDFWKERFQVESRSRIQAEQRAADALARAEKAAEDERDRLLFEATELARKPNATTGWRRGLEATCEYLKAQGAMLPDARSSSREGASK